MPRSLTRFSPALYLYINLIVSICLVVHSISVAQDGQILVNARIKQEKLSNMKILDDSLKECGVEKMIPSMNRI